MSHLRGTSNKYLHQYLFPEDTSLLPELRHMILEYWVPSEFLSYLDTWSRTAYFDSNGKPYWYDNYKGVGIAYIEPQPCLHNDTLLRSVTEGDPYHVGIDEAFELRCANWFIDYDPKYIVYDNCEYFDNRSNLFLNIALMISISNNEHPWDRQYIGQGFIPIEFLDSYSVETSKTNDEYIKLNISKLTKAHLQKANTLDVKDVKSMQQYIIECKELFELIKANPED